MTFLETRANCLINIYLPEDYLINTPNYTYVKGKVFIDIIYYNPESNYTSVTNFLTIISPALSELFSINITLRLTKIYYPYINSIILGKYFVAISDTNTLKHFFNSLGKPQIYPILASVSGIRIKMYGRLLSKPFTKKNPIEVREYGIFNHTKYFLDKCDISATNSLGTFTLYISICQRISI